MAKPIPEGYQSVTPSMSFKDTKKALAFYKKALNAKEIVCLDSPAGKGVMHAVMQVGNSLIMMGDEMPGCQSAESTGHSPTSLYLYVDDVDAVFKQAVAAGAKEVMPVMDMFWGDRAGNLKDPFGYPWMIATHKSDPTPEQVKKGAQEFFASMSKGAK
jgi:PhnB protein